ncbi:uncharacterized protein LOC136063519 [Quercus suber]|uniref:uncharacterized protein LOC136063519 n=1 Tax=Quercus suber TaxID=58331 RepID=UPI0032DF9418
MQFLMGLNESYSQIKGQILLMEPLPTINKVYSLLIQEERQRSIGLSNSVHIESTTLAVKGSNANFNPNFPGFFGNSGAYGKNSKGRDRPICTHCGKFGHVMEKCFKLHGFPPGFKPKGKNFMVNQVNIQEACTENDHTSATFPFTQEQCQQFLTMLGTQMQVAHLTSSGNETQFNLGNKETHMASNVIRPTLAVPSSSNATDTFTMAGNSTCLDLRHLVFSAQITHRTAFGGNIWVIDTGATDHIVYSVHLLTNFTAIDCVVALPNGETALVTYIGSICLSENLVLTNVLCVPSFSFNLLSVSQLTKKMHCCLIFLSTFCFIQDLNCWRTIGVGEVHDGLYLLQHSPSDTCAIPIQSQATPSFQSVFNSVFQSIFSTNKSHVVNNVKIPASIWHSRLGHPSDAKISVLKNVLPDLHFNKSVSNQICEICPLAKHKRIPFPFPNHVSEFPFDLIHCDIWGPYVVPTVAGHRYFLTIVDDCTRSTWVYLMKSKSETRSLL